MLFRKEFQAFDSFTFSLRKVTTMTKNSHNYFINVPTMQQVLASTFRKIYPSIKS